MHIPKGRESLVTHILNTEAVLITLRQVPQWVPWELTPSLGVCPHAGASRYQTAVEHAKVKQPVQSAEALQAGKAEYARQGQSVIFCQLLISKLATQNAEKSQRTEGSLKKKKFLKP